MRDDSVNEGSGMTAAARSLKQQYSNRGLCEALCVHDSNGPVLRSIDRFVQMSKSENVKVKCALLNQFDLFLYSKGAGEAPSETFLCRYKDILALSIDRSPISTIPDSKYKDRIFRTTRRSGV
ncbi:hypothetical protein NQD34_011480 [Periophthalmus magnuspinnatus]|nr:hypothetical protein NQD34_011480 [Periophthalmus magnuspinnatus]